MRQQVEHYEQMAKGMGYATVDEMIQKTAEGYKVRKGAGADGAGHAADHRRGLCGQDDAA